jgi:crotonobetainyl-CoA:carnitine CoA-transferase CaiB-like acyl-CoA transferase
VSTRRKPLEGMLVLDFSQYVAGPFATTLLADLGADVIKAERPGGDAYRSYDPVAPGQSHFFCSLNRGKRSVICDLSRAAGRNMAAGLIARADALVHNFVPEKAAQFGLDPTTLQRENPDLVVCSVSAYGTVGPLAGIPGYDLIAQATSGLLALNSQPGQRVPERAAGIPLTDVTTGLLTAVAVLSGLIERDRRRGESPETAARSGLSFEVSLLGAALALQTQELPRTMQVPATRADRSTLGHLAASRARKAAIELYYRCYETADSFIAVACLDVAQRRAMLGVLDLEDPYVDNPQRPPADEHEEGDRAALVLHVEAIIRDLPSCEWVRRFAEADVPAAEVVTTASAAGSEQAAANGLVMTIDQPGIGPVRLLGGVIKQNGEALMSHQAAPWLGEHQHLVGELLKEVPAKPAGLIEQ